MIEYLRMHQSVPISSRPAKWWPKRQVVLAVLLALAAGYAAGRAQDPLVAYMAHMQEERRYEELWRQGWLDAPQEFKDIQVDKTYKSWKQQDDTIQNMMKTLWEYQGKIPENND